MSAVSCIGKCGTFAERVRFSTLWRWRRRDGMERRPFPSRHCWFAAWRRGGSSACFSITTASPAPLATLSSLTTATSEFDGRRYCHYFLYFQCLFRFFFINWFMKCHKVVTSEAPYLPRGGRNHLRTRCIYPRRDGRAEWALSGLHKYRDNRPAEGGHQSQY